MFEFPVNTFCWWIKACKHISREKRKHDLILKLKKHLKISALRIPNTDYPVFKWQATNQAPQSQSCDTFRIQIYPVVMHVYSTLYSVQWTQFMKWKERHKRTRTIVKPTGTPKMADSLINKTCNSERIITCWKLAFNTYTRTKTRGF